MKYVALLLTIFAGVVIGNDIIGIYHNAKLPWDSFWDVLFISSPAYLFEIIAALVLIVTSYCCLMKR